MPEHLRSLVVILGIAVPIFLLAKAAFCPQLLSKEEFLRRRNLWIAITLTAFLSHNFWICMLLVGILLSFFAKNESNKVGMMLFVILALPLMRAEIPGIAGIRYVFDLDYFKVISFTVLLPLLVREINQYNLKHFTSEPTDKFLYGYWLYMLCLVALASNITGIMRSTFVTFIEIVVPYAIVSRTLKDHASLKSALSSYVIGASIMAGVGFVEFSRNWLLYNSLEPALGVNWSLGGYLKRGDSLRAIATGGQAIPYGYTMAVGFCLLLGLKHYFKNKTLWVITLALLSLGMLSSYSRGPWVGAVAGLVIFLLTGPEKKKNLTKLLIYSLLIGIPVLLSPMGQILSDKVMVESGSFDYRERVFEVSLSVIMANPLFGAYNFLYSSAMQELRQGQGIIDIVNTYIAVGLRSGLVGVFLFSGFLLSACWCLWKRIDNLPDVHMESQGAGRGLLAALVCIVVTIATVSSISFIPAIYFIFTALAVAWLRMTRVSQGMTTGGSATKSATEDKTWPGRGLGPSPGRSL